MTLRVLVTGATGKQGGAVVKALLALNRDINVIALTRDPTSEKARSLAALSNVKLQKGDLDDAQAIEAVFATEKFDGVFSVQDHFVKDEVAQGKLLADLAKKYNVGRFVYSASAHADVFPNPVANFGNKILIERHIVENLSDLNYTIIRPAAFMDNFHWPVYPSVVLAVGNESDLLDQVALSDIGKAVAQILTSGSQQYDQAFKGKVVPLVGDTLNLKETFDIIREEKGKIYEKHQGDVGPLGTVMQFLITHSDSAKPAITKQNFPSTKSFREWVQTEFFP